jgi:hypothetical protein
MRPTPFIDVAPSGRSGKLASALLKNLIGMRAEARLDAGENGMSAGCAVLRSRACGEGDMPAKHLIIVHGRDIKPAGSELAALAKSAVARGLERAGKVSTADKIRQGTIKFSSAYYGDVNNEIEASYSAKTKALLTAQNDTAYPFKPCFPIAELKDAFVKTDVRLSHASGHGRVQRAAGSGVRARSEFT